MYIRTQESIMILQIHLVCFSGKQRKSCIFYSTLPEITKVLW